MVLNAIGRTRCAPARGEGIGCPVTIRRVHRLCKIGSLGLPSCAVADMEHLNMILPLQDAVYHTIDMRLLAVKQVPQFVSRSSGYWSARK